VKIMRSVVAYLVLIPLSIVNAAARPKITPDPLTIVFRFDGPYSEKSLVEMKRELRTILKDSGIHIDWRDQSNVAAADSFPNLVVVKFRGKCRMEPLPYLYDERGPLAFTYSTDGAVLPFSEIECDKVRSSLHTAMLGGDHNRSDLLFGRALARVLAHELYHVLAKTHSHAGQGIAEKALSGAQLISERLRLNPAELNQMHDAVLPSAGR
jgi:hypothetical protein